MSPELRTAARLWLTQYRLQNRSLVPKEHWDRFHAGLGDAELGVYVDATHPGGWTAFAAKHEHGVTNGNGNPN